MNGGSYCYGTTACQGYGWDGLLLLTLTVANGVSYRQLAGMHILLAATS